MAGHGRGLCDRPDKETIEHRRNILPKAGLALLQDVFSAHGGLLSYMSIYTHIQDNKKTPTSQENCGRVIKKVPKGLNCYNDIRRVLGDVVYYLTI